MADRNTIQRSLDNLGSTIVRAGELVRKARVEFGSAHEPRHRLLIALVACVAACALTALLLARFGETSALDFAEAPLKDLRVRALTDTAQRDPDILVIAIDEQALAYGDNPAFTRDQQSQRYAWPWPRHVYNKLIRYCREGGARVIVLDLFFTETGPNTNDPLRVVKVGERPVRVWLGDKAGDDLFILEVTARDDVVLALSTSDEQRAAELRDELLPAYAATLDGAAAAALRDELARSAALRPTPVTPIAGLLSGWPASTAADLSEFEPGQRQPEAEGYYRALERGTEAFQSDRFSSLLPLPAPTLHGVAGVGAVNVEYDAADGVQRRYPALSVAGGETYRHMALEIWRVFVLSHAREAQADAALREAFAERFPGLRVDEAGLHAGERVYALDGGLRDVPVTIERGWGRYLGREIPLAADGQYHLRYRAPLPLEQDVVFRLVDDEQQRALTRARYEREPVPALYPTVSAATILADWDAWHFREHGYDRRRAELRRSASRAREDAEDLSGAAQERAQSALQLLEQQFAALPESGPPGGWPRVRLGEPSAVVKDKVVFIAGTAAGLADRHPTPWSPSTPGTYVVANSFDNLRNGDFMRASPRWMDWALGFAAALAAVLAVIYSRRPRNGLLFVLGFAALACIASWAGFKLQWWLPTAAPLAGLFIGFGNGALAKALTEGRQRRQREAFARQYMGQELLDYVIKHPGSLKLGGENREMSVFFNDVAGFTTVSETLGPNNPERLVELLNIYLERMTDLMLETGGVIDKYIGDAIMCFWGAPMDMQDHAVRACRGAIACRAEMQRMQPLFADTVRGVAPQLIGADGTVLRARAGINSGLMTVGNMGSSKRFAYTVMGDAVNLAARLEPQCKEYGTEILIGAGTERLIRGEFNVRPIDLVVVKGKTEPLEIFELLGSKEAPQFVLDLMRHFNEGVELFRARQFEAALKAFQQALPNEPKQDGINPSQTYIQRCEQLVQQPPPPEWNGVYVKTTK